MDCRSTAADCRDASRKRNEKRPQPEVAAVFTDAARLSGESQRLAVSAGLSPVRVSRSMATVVRRHVDTVRPSDAERNSSEALPLNRGMSRRNPCRSTRHRARRLIADRRGTRRRIHRWTRGRLALMDVRQHDALSGQWVSGHRLRKSDRRELWIGNRPDGSETGGRVIRRLNRILRTLPVDACLRVYVGRNHHDGDGRQNGQNGHCLRCVECVAFQVPVPPCMCAAAVRPENWMWFSLWNGLAAPPLVNVRSDSGAVTAKS